MFFTGLIIGILATVIAIVLVLPKQMFIVNESKLDFNATVTAIEKSAKEHKWSMPHQYDLQATMMKHGFAVKPVKVFSLCKPQASHRKTVNT